MNQNDDSLRAAGFDLDCLFSDLAPGVFLDQYFPAKPLVSHSDIALRLLTKTVVHLSDPIEIIKSSGAVPIRLWQEKESRTVTHDQAISGFLAGGAIYISNAERVYGELSSCLEILCGELGIPASRASCSIFMSPKGAEVPLHFDHDFGINMLVKGRKRWTLAQNTSVTWPTVGYDASKGPLVELARYLTGPLPGAVPDNCQTIDANPGSVCFLPRGLWHMTYAYEECIALDFAIDPLCWADYLSEVIRELLISVPAGRESAFGLIGISRFREHYLNRMEAVAFSVQDLMRTVSSWST